jgi:glyoxylase-like metal-dependent hydrolase (beta-lactamase superfamily II)/rhodanese-related sulfurtransferase
MYFKQFLYDELGCSSYFVASRQSREAVVVDPQLDIQPYLDLAAERHYAIRYIIDTHLHADHVSGNRRLAAATGAETCMHEAADVLFPIRRLKDGEELHVGQLIFRVVHTPGHRPESISVLVINPPRSPEPSIVLSGDCLFVGDVGRADFGGPEGTLEEYQSVQKLLALPDYVEVFPAHFEGSCGKGMCGRPSSTIGFERRYNPMLQLGREEFLQVAAQPPARPLNMDAILATNRGEAEYAWANPREAAVDNIPVEEAARRKEAGALVVDVREPWEYQAGHIPGALSIPQAELATRINELPKDRDVLVVCQSGMRSLRCAQFLSALGFGRVLNVEGGTGGWREAGFPVESGASTSTPSAAAPAAPA